MEKDDLVRSFRDVSSHLFGGEFNRSGSYVWIPNCMNECGCVAKLSPTLRRSVPRGIGTPSCRTVVRQQLQFLVVIK